MWKFFTKDGQEKQIVSYSGAGPKVTTGLLSAGPPAGPADGDIWIATNVQSGTRWQFQYDASEVTANKWKFIGGPPMAAGGGYGSVALTLSQAALAGYILTVPRSGLYRVNGRIQGRLNPIAAGSYFYVGLSVNGAAIGTGDDASGQGYTPNNIPAGQALGSGDLVFRMVAPRSYTAADVLSMAGYCGSTAGAMSHYGYQLELIPVAIA